MRRSLTALAFVMTTALMSGCSPHREAEEAVRQLMRDPDATQFRDLTKCSNDRTVTRGEYNSKNAFGAYVGFEYFYYAPDVGVVFLGDSDFSQMLERCFGSDAAAADDLEAAAVDEEAPVVERAENDAPAEDIEPEPINSCFGDYCPCDTSDPDYGGADVTLCRNLEQGIAVDDEMFAAAAGMRDARKQLREFEEQEGGF